MFQSLTIGAFLYAITLERVLHKDFQTAIFMFYFKDFKNNFTIGKVLYLEFFSCFVSPPVPFSGPLYEIL